MNENSLVTIQLTNHCQQRRFYFSWRSEQHIHPPKDDEGVSNVAFLADDALVQVMKA